MGPTGKEIWIKDGDENTAFFHKCCTTKQRKSVISEIQDDQGNTHCSNISIADALVHYFKNLYNGKNMSIILLENLDWHQILDDHHQLLCASFEEEEIRKIIFSFENNKALGPDSIPLHSYKSFQHILKTDIMEVFKDFHSKGVINNNVNNTHIALISKKKRSLQFCQRLQVDQSHHFPVQNHCQDISKQIESTLLKLSLKINSLL